MQYTGYRDKNGIRIYEGDVLVKVDDTYEELCTIVYKDGCFYLFHRGMEDPLFLDGQSFYETYYEVIGNVYENEDDVLYRKVRRKKMSECIYVDEFVEIENVKTFIDSAEDEDVAEIIKYCKKKRIESSEDYGLVQNCVYEMGDEEARALIKWIRHYKPYLFEFKKDENERLFA
ncbi:hypothetical protein A9K75_09935 [Campylobacter fetus subsp. testudinum]|nr:hypothetical protein A9K75_09935 [Campylobacter fetus subsp. testudinum]